MRVLVVDDDEKFLRSMHRLLCQLGCRPTTALGLAQSVEPAKIDEFDVVFVDLLMPDADGLEALRRFRGMRAAVVLVSGWHSKGPDYLRMGLDLGADAILRKPFGVEELRRVLSEVLPSRTMETRGVF